ncbi:hypothetical protein, partial [Nocardia brasiliensis]|uniref:hypothetical protein n=1 Tax=Nocardia brasiliensis TaxID=37326 RepID=UPI0024587806
DGSIDTAWTEQARLKLRLNIDVIELEQNVTGEVRHNHQGAAPGRPRDAPGRAPPPFRVLRR